MIAATPGNQVAAPYLRMSCANTRYRRKRHHDPRPKCAVPALAPPCRNYARNIIEVRNVILTLQHEAACAERLPRRQSIARQPVVAGPRGSSHSPVVRTACQLRLGTRRRPAAVTNLTVAVARPFGSKACCPRHRATDCSRMAFMRAASSDSHGTHGQGAWRVAPASMRPTTRFCFISRWR